MTSRRVVFFEVGATDCRVDPSNHSKAGEPGGYRDIGNTLRRRGYEVVSHKDNPIWQSSNASDILFIVRTRNCGPVPIAQTDAIRRFVESGGRLLIFFDSLRETAGYCNLNDIIEPWGVRFNDDLLWDQDDCIVQSGDGWRSRIGLGDVDRNHPVTSGISRIWYWGCSLSIRPKQIDSIKITPLLFGSSSAYSARPGMVITRRDDEFDYEFRIMALNDPYISGQRPPVLATVEFENTGGRALVFGACYTFNNDSLRLDRFELNGYDHEGLLINMIDWLAEGQSAEHGLTPPNLFERLRYALKDHRARIESFLIGVVAGVVTTILAYAFRGLLGLDF